MKHKIGAIIALILAIIGLVLAGITIYQQETKEPEKPAEDLLSGSALRQMMNEAKWSPGLADGYVKEHPTYAWLFDGSYITYIEK